MESPCECGIEPPDSISHGVSSSSSSNSSSSSSVGIDDLGIACSSRDRKLADSKRAEIVGFSQEFSIPKRRSLRTDFGLGPKSRIFRLVEKPQV